MSASLSVQQALATVLTNVSPLAEESVVLARAAGRVLAEELRADADQPPFDRAAMDGYAVRAADLQHPPVTLDVVGQLRAGQPPWSTRLLAGQALQIMTGAAVPSGADAVVPVEHTRGAGDGRVELREGIGPGQNVAPRASELRAGEVVCGAGLRVDAAAVALLASVGAARVRVARRPRVAVLVTGDELVGVDQSPATGQIRNSNGPALMTLAAGAGADVAALGVAPDVTERLRAALEEGLRFDVVLVSGGVSAGEFDLVEPVLAQLGVQVLFERVALKPGAPMVFARRGATLVFGLPGNPVSTQVTFELFVRPALLALQGARDLNRPRLAAELDAPLVNRSRRENYLPVMATIREGRLMALPIRSQGSADVRAHAQANALAVLPPERERAEPGETVELLLLERFEAMVPT